MTTFYLAGPIGDVKDQSYIKWRDVVTKRLRNIGVNVLNPLDKYEDKVGDVKKVLDTKRDEQDYDSVKEIMGDILRLDKELVRRADGVLAYVPADMGYTVGTIREISLAYEWSKPIIVITDIKRLSNSLVGMATHVVYSFDEAIEKIGEYYKNRRSLRPFIYKDTSKEPTGPTQKEIKQVVRAYLERTRKDTFTAREIAQSKEMEDFMADKRYKSIRSYVSKITAMARKGYFEVIR
jgi:nucleoside 2-deoxyribosyltransferase